jgi:excisionase family DNA binding protein
MIDFQCRWKGNSVLFRNLPVLKCSVCGFTSLTIDASALMTDFIDRKVESGQSLPPVLTVNEAAEYLRVSTQTIYNLQKSSALPGVKIGGQLRFRREALEALLRPAADTGNAPSEVREDRPREDRPRRSRPEPEG